MEFVTETDQVEAVNDRIRANEMQIVQLGLSRIEASTFAVVPEETYGGSGIPIPTLVNTGGLGRGPLLTEAQIDAEISRLQAMNAALVAHRETLV